MARSSAAARVTHEIAPTKRTTVREVEDDVEDDVAETAEGSTAGWPDWTQVPWHPELKVGVMVDISGSMGDAMNPMAVTAWVMSEAVRRVQGKAAMVYYGNDVFATLKPGQHLREVNVYTAPDGTEKFDAAFKSLDGSMNLLQGSGARLLVIVSDGDYVTEERQAAQKWVRECERAGVGVLWITFRGKDSLPQKYLAGTSGQVVVSDGVASKVAKTIGEAAARALTKVGARRAS